LHRAQEPRSCQRRLACRIQCTISYLVSVAAAPLLISSADTPHPTPMSPQLSPGSRPSPKANPDCGVTSKSQQIQSSLPLSSLLAPQIITFSAPQIIHPTSTNYPLPLSHLLPLSTSHLPSQKDNASLGSHILAPSLLARDTPHLRYKSLYKKNRQPCVQIERFDSQVRPFLD
jgi:hypothetical protein